MTKNSYDKIWGYVEKLYIHCYRVDGFVKFLKSNEILLPDDFYNNFEIYSFMTTENCNFSDFMISNVDDSKYKKIISQVIFDKKIIKTKDIDWNYLGVKIKEWYPKLLKEVDNVKISLYENINEKDLLIYNTKNPFLDHLISEINDTYNNKNYVAVIMLMRKLMECMIIIIFETYFPKTHKGTFNKSNHELWYNYSTRRYQEFETLLSNLDLKQNDFHEDRFLVSDTCKVIKKFKDEANRIVHRDYKIPDKMIVDNYKIPEMYNMIAKIYSKYCS